MLAGHPRADQPVDCGHVLGQRSAQPVLRSVLLHRAFAHTVHVVPPPLPRATGGSNPISMKELLSTTDPTVIAFATVLLRGEGITAFPLDVHMSVLDGSLGILPQRLMVADQDHFRAVAILRDNDIPLKT